MKKYALIIFILLISLPFVNAENIHKTIGDLRNSYYKASGIERMDIAEKMVPLMISNNSIKDAENILTDLANGNATDDVFNARWLILKANIFEAQFDYSNAMNNYYEALTTFKEKDIKNLLADTYFKIGKNFYAQGEVGKGVENLKLANDLYLDLADNHSLALTYTELGEIYFKKEIYGKSKKYYKSSLELFIENGNYSKAAESAEMLGQIEVVLEDYDAALSYYNNAREIYFAQNNNLGVAKNTFNEAKVYFVDDSTDEAQEKLLEALALIDSQNNRLLFAKMKAFEGQLYISKGDNSAAAKELMVAGKVLDSTGNNPESLKIYKDISDTFFDMSDYKNAYVYLEKYQITKDLVFNEEKSKILFEVSKRFESKFNDKEQKQQISLLEMDKKSSIKLNYSLGFGFCALLGGLFLLFRSNKQKRKDNEVLQLKNNEIKLQAEKIKEKQEELLNAKIELENLNGKLVKEMGDRESIESNSFNKDKFIANKSNAMRTPLQNVVGAAHLIQNENITNETEENIDTLMNSVNELVVHINDILEYSNVEAGKVVLNDKPFNFKKLIASSESNFKQILRARNISLYYTLDKNIPDVLVGDANKLKQILHNYIEDLLRNAQSGNQFLLNVKLKELINKQITLNFDLNFKGNLTSLDNQDSTFMFELETVKNFNVEKIDIARRMIELQGSKVIEEILPDGKRIIFDLHFKTLDEDEQLIEKNFNFDNRHILLIEDNKINQMVVKKMLERKGINVTTADNGQIGLDLFKNNNFDLVLMDIQMPVMDGYEAAAEIRKLPLPIKNKVPIIALTASAYLTEKEKANLFGMNDYVGKPFSPEELLNKVFLHLQKVNA